MMKKNIVSLLVIIAAFSCLIGAKEKDPFDLGLKYEKLEFTPPVPERFVMDNGAIVYFLQDKSLPIVKVSVLTHTGSIYDPKDKLGLAYMTGALMRSGGSKNFPEDAMDEQLDFIAANLSSGIERHMSTVDLDVMKKDVDLGFNALADLLINPLFPQDKIDIRKNKILEEYRRRNDSAGSLAFTATVTKIYGDHPYVRRSAGKPETLKNITRDDIVAFHKKYFRPDNTIFAVSGSISKEEFKRLFEKHFGTWKAPKEPIAFPEVPAVKQPEGAMFFVPKNVPQCTVYSGHLGLRNCDPINTDASLMNQILGGGFNSRLVTRIRSEAGLAYVSGSFVSSQKDYGVFMAYVGTKPEGVPTVIKIIRDEMERIKKEPVKVEELEAARENRENSFVFNFTSIHNITTTAATYEYNGYPKDQLKIYLQRLNAATPDSILKAAQTLLMPDKLVTVIIGPERVLPLLKEKFPGITELNPEDF